MSTLLAPNLIAPLQRHARITLAAQVCDSRSFQLAARSTDAASSSEAAVGAEDVLRS